MWLIILEVYIVFVMILDKNFLKIQLNLKIVIMVYVFCKDIFYMCYLVVVYRVFVFNYILFIQCFV